MRVPTLSRVLRLDSIKLDGTYFTDEGYLIDHPIVTSVGIFEYTNPDGSIRRELRLPEDVFAKESLESYKGKPIIITHDAGVVTKENVDGEGIGTILSEGYQDGNDVRAEIVIHDTDELKRCGLRELSLGYNLTLDETPGVWNGQPYDARQKGITINHLALVGEARAGEQARLNIDGKEKSTTLKGAKAMATKKNTTRKDGVPMNPEELKAAIEAFKARKAQRAEAHTGDCGAQMDDEVAPPAAEPTSGAESGEPTKNADAEETVQTVKDRRDRRDAEGDPDTPEKSMGVIAQQDEDIDSLLKVIEAMMAKQDFDEADKENADEGEAAKTDEGEGENKDGSEDKSGSLNTDSVDRLFRQRLEVVRIGDRLHLDGIDTMSLFDAKKAIIKKVNPSMRLDGKGVAYINAAFDLAKDTISQRKDTNYQRGQMFNSDSSRPPASEKSNANEARKRMIDRMNGGKE